MNTVETIRSTFTSILCTACVGLLSLLWVGTVWAQQEPEDEPPAEETETAPEDAVVLEKVTVTAAKREQLAREVPVSVSVVREEQLNNFHVSQLTDIAAYVPGLQVTSGGSPGQTTISLRGIAPISPGSAVRTYIDQVPVGSSGFYQRATAFALDLLPYDIQRIEVLRGPQGTLYGASALGGIIKYVTRDPDLNGYLLRVGAGISRVEGADDLGWDARITANMPLVENTLGLRMSYARNHITGFIDNAVTGEEDINDGEQESGRASFLWRISNDVSVEFSAMRQTIDSDNNAQVALDPETLEPIFGDLTNNVFINEPFEKEIDFYTASLRWDLGWADFLSATGYTDVVTSQRVDATGIFGEFPLILGQPPGISSFTLGLDLQKLTQEFRLTSKPDGRFDWQVGFFYTDEEAENSQVARLFTLEGDPVAGLDPLTILAIPSDYEEIALFANASYAFTDRFEVGAGVRFAQNDQSFAQIVEPGSPLIAPGVTPGESEEDIFLYSISPQFKLNEDSMIYGRVATGYQPGGPNVALPNVPPSVDSSTVTSYEAGLKSTFADGRGRMDIALFHIDWQDIQVTASEAGVSFLTNAGEAVSQGIELSAAFKPVRQLRLGFNAAYTNAELTEDGPQAGGFVTGLDGDRLPYIPEFSWSAIADYNFPLAGGWTGRIGGGLRWVGERESALSTTNPAAFESPRLDSYYALDLNAEIANANWIFSVYIQNVTDERAYLTIAPITGPITGITHKLLAVPIQPRTIGFTVDYKF